MGAKAEDAKLAIANAEASNDYLNLVDVIAKLRGWNPLEIDEDMIVSFGDNKRYRIICISDSE